MQLLWSKFSPVFRRFLISYLVILMIPQIAGYASYRASIEAARSSSIENSLKSLSLGKEIIERNLLQVEAFTRQLAVNPDLQNLIAGPKPHDLYNVYGMNRMQRSLSMYSSTNDYLSHFFIHIPNYNAIITPRTVYYRPEHYYAANQLTVCRLNNGMTKFSNNHTLMKSYRFETINVKYSALCLQTFPPLLFCNLCL